MSQPQSSTETRYAVQGMTCDHCVHAVTAEIGRIPGVRDVTVSLADGSVTVASDLPLDRTAVAAAINEAGYQVA